MLALVLEKRNWRENDQIVSLYTKELGKFDVLVKGGKRISVKNTVGLESGFLIDAEVVFNGERNSFVKCLPVNSFKNLRSNWNEIREFNKILFFLKDNLREKDQDDKIFDLTLDFLHYFDYLEFKKDFFKSFFLLKFLTHSGFKPGLSKCLDCEEDILSEDKKVYFSFAQGGVSCCQKNSLNNSSGCFLDFEELSVLSKILNGDWEELVKLDNNQVIIAKIRDSILGFAEYVLNKNLAYFA